MRDLDFSTVIEQRDWVAAGEVTARELVEHSLRRIAVEGSTSPALVE